MTTETQPEMNLGLLQLVTYVQDFKEAKQAFDQKKKDFLDNKFKLFEERLIKELPEDFTNLFTIKVSNVSSCSSRLKYPFDKDAGLEEWWQNLLNSDDECISLSLLFTSKEIPDFNFYLIAVLGVGDSYKLEGQLESATSFTKQVPVIYEPGKVDYLQAFIAEKFNKVKPCSNCPFRSDIDFPLGIERRREIADSLLNDQVFLCHKQLKLAVADRRPCVGSARVLDKTEGVLSNVAYRLHCMFNGFPTEYDNDVPVFNNLEEFINSDNKSH